MENHIVDYAYYNREKRKAALFAAISSQNVHYIYRDCKIPSSMPKKKLPHKLNDEVILAHMLVLLVGLAAKILRTNSALL